MWLRVLAGLAFLFVLWTLFRFAMALRFSKLQREEARRREEARGRRVVAELPLENDVEMFVEDAAGFEWGAARVAKAEVQGARLVLNGGVMASFAREGAALPELSVPEEFEGRERWEVRIWLGPGGWVTVPCGTLREGVSREAATRVFDAVKHAAHPEPPAR